MEGRRAAVVLSSVYERSLVPPMHVIMHAIIVVVPCHRVGIVPITVVVPS